MNDDTTLQIFLNLQKEKGNKKLQEVATQVKENDKMINKLSAKRDFPLFYGRNVPALSPKIIEYLWVTNQKISLSDEETKEMVNKEEKLDSD